ncbi:hypothetical protein Mpop_5448 (plasmid) [Methylorubrum populi BJ001]|uniref:DUF3168 domain-containing protein n=1 Tax=Methylorubrum populi (strain ATCC BAA-705 / NCIMB 13946 / BJ001) TaxID=441620 RepID=B1ZM65_METPB|nr:DUF3168 domain-containing protein [Methylorubrum populi]ACB83538.1 hypothetical protein Mpop_5448 [Methylorubrum populi BJ001]
MSALALQKAMGARLAGFPAVTDLVPPANIVDAHGRPARFPSVILGDGQEVAADLTFERRHVTVFVDLHVWDRSPSFTSTKAIAGAIRAALHGDDLVLDEGRLLDLKHAGTRYLRDPDGQTAHAVVTIEALVEETRP